MCVEVYGNSRELFSYSNGTLRGEDDDNNNTDAGWVNSALSSLSAPGGTTTFLEPINPYTFSAVEITFV